MLIFVNLTSHLNYILERGANLIFRTLLQKCRSGKKWILRKKRTAAQFHFIIQAKRKFPSCFSPHHSSTYHSWSLRLQEKLTTPSFFISIFSSFMQCITPEDIFLLSLRYPFFAAIYTTVAKKEKKNCIVHIFQLCFRVSKKCCQRRTFSIPNNNNETISAFALFAFLTFFVISFLKKINQIPQLLFIWFTVHKSD